MSKEQISAFIDSLGNTNGKRISINHLDETGTTLALTLFKNGASVVVADRDNLQVNKLNRLLYELSGSAYRYRAVAFGSIQHEPVDIFIDLVNLEEEIKKEYNDGYKHRKSFQLKIEEQVTKPVPTAVIPVVTKPVAIAAVLKAPVVAATIKPVIAPVAIQVKTV